ncbi:MAG: 30S ribosomal protein S7 [Patescibacteria group bacterium]|nr:30S ribosomal protein S7 [Patescibacteria group bacterium]
MARGNSKTKKHRLEPDAKFDSITVTKFINYIMLNGKKSVSEQIVYESLKTASEKLKTTEMEIFEQALKNVGPILEVKSKRIGGANYQVPVEVSKDRRNTLAMRWIINAARDGKGKPMAEKLANEFVNSYHGEGAAIKKKQDTHRMAEANKAFAHFARF